MEEVKQKCEGVQLQNEDVYMATTFHDFIQMFVRKLRGEDQEEELVVDYVSLTVCRKWSDDLAVRSNLRLSVSSSSL